VLVGLPGGLTVLGGFAWQWRAALADPEMPMMDLRRFADRQHLDNTSPV
jgi:hypothetical protein